MAKATASGYDHPWKDAIEDLFPYLILFANRRLYKRIDWSKPFRFLEKELRQITKQRSNKGRRYVDKLVQVAMKDGTQEWLYIHIEIQNDRDSEFPKRMFVYHYRLFEKYGENITSLAVLGDLDADWQPKSYSYGRDGCRTTFKFPMLKLLDYEKKWDTLVRSRNPFATVIMAHLKTKQTKGNHAERAKWKLTFLRMAVTRKMPRKDVEAVFKFIDWVMVLPEALDKQVDLELEKSVEVNEMAYVSRWERRGKIEGKIEGKKEGKQEILIRLLKVKFGALPAWVLEKVDKAEVTNLVSWAEAVLFKNTLEDVFSS